jgi:hypothetical protein
MRVSWDPDKVVWQLRICVVNSINDQNCSYGITAHAAGNGEVDQEALADNSLSDVLRGGGVPNEPVESVFVVPIKATEVLSYFAVKVEFAAKPDPEIVTVAPGT